MIKILKTNGEIIEFDSGNAPVHIFENHNKYLVLESKIGKVIITHPEKELLHNLLFDNMRG